MNTSSLEPISHPFQIRPGCIGSGPPKALGREGFLEPWRTGRQGARAERGGLTQVVIVLLLPLLGQGPAFSIWRPREKKEELRGRERREMEGARTERQVGTCKLTLLGQVRWAGAAGDTHQ